MLDQANMINEDNLAQGVRSDAEVRPLKNEITELCYKLKVLREAKTAAV